MKRAFIGLGSSLGDRRANLERGVDALRSLAKDDAIRVSSFHETAAVLPPGAAADWDVPYLNAVATFEWDDSAMELLSRLKILEVSLGRTAAPRWAPRIIDLDLLLLGDERIESAFLKLPHPSLLDRSFVLEPLCEIAPELAVGPAGESALTMARRLRAPSGTGYFSLLPA